MLSSPETIHIHAVLSHFVVEDAFGRAQQASGFRAISSRGFESVKNEISFVGGDGLGQRKPRERA